MALRNYRLPPISLLDNEWQWKMEFCRLNGMAPGDSCNWDTADYNYAEALYESQS